MGFSPSDRSVPKTNKQEQKKREAMFYIAVGMKGIGKTYNSLQVIDRYVKGNPRAGIKPRKVLIFDVNNEYGMYRPIASDANTIAKFSVQKTVECRRISAIRPDGRVKSSQDFKEDLDNILDNFRGGMIVLEDLALLVGDTASVKLIGSLSTNRHRDLDVITHFQSIAKFTNPKIYALKNVLRLHKTADSCQRPTPRRNLEDDYDIVRIAELIVSDRYDKGVEMCDKLESEGKIGSEEYKKYDTEYRRFYLHVNFDKHKITGAFTQEEFTDACKKYLQEELKTEVKPLLNYVDIETGKKQYDLKTAFEKKLAEKMRYNGSQKN